MVQRSSKTIAVFFVLQGQDGLEQLVDIGSLEFGIITHSIAPFSRFNTLQYDYSTHSLGSIGKNDRFQQFQPFIQLVILQISLYQFYVIVWLDPLLMDSVAVGKVCDGDSHVILRRYSQYSLDDPFSIGFFADHRSAFVIFHPTYQDFRSTGGSLVYQNPT